AIWRWETSLTSLSKTWREKLSPWTALQIGLGSFGCSGALGEAADFQSRVHLQLKRFLGHGVWWRFGGVWDLSHISLQNLEREARPLDCTTDRGGRSRL